MSKNGKRGSVIALIALIAVAAALLTAYLLLRPPPAAGSKTIQVEVVLADGNVKTHTIRTAAPTLRGALEENGLIAGDESQMGLFVKTVDGVTADDSQRQWWCFTKGGVSLTTGVDQTPIADGDHFEITLTTGYGN